MARNTNAGTQFSGTHGSSECSASGLVPKFSAEQSIFALRPRHSSTTAERVPERPSAHDQRQRPRTGTSHAGGASRRGITSVRPPGLASGPRCVSWALQASPGAFALVCPLGYPQESARMPTLGCYSSRIRWPRAGMSSLSSNHSMYWPNHSLELTRYGSRRLAAPEACGIFSSAAKRRLPPRAAQLER
jgi:hypothetical protein